MKIKSWKCHNCGHEEQAAPDGTLKELDFKWLGELTSRVSCPACGAYTLQQAYDDTFYAGIFLAVVPKNRIKGKG